MARRVALSLLPLLCTLSACFPSAADDAGGEEESARFEELRVSTPDGLDLYVRIQGSGRDTVIIGAAAWLAGELDPLIPGRTLIFYDPRSRGGSDYVADPERLSMDLEVEDVEAVRAHFNVSQVSLIGWSYLGAVVALYAARHPEVVRSVVQIGPMAPRDAIALPPEPRGSPPSQQDLDYIAALAASGLPASNPVAYCREVAMRQILRPMMGRPEAAARARTDPCMYWNEWPAQVFATIGKFIPQATGEGWDYSEEAAAVQAPVLTVHGTADPNAAVEGGREWASLMPNARLVELDGVGHAPWLEAPEEFFDSVDAFLRQP